MVSASVGIGMASPLAYHQGWIPRRWLALLDPITGVFCTFLGFLPLVWVHNLVQKRLIGGGCFGGRGIGLMGGTQTLGLDFGCYLAFPAIYRL